MKIQQFVVSGGRQVVGVLNDDRRELTIIIFLDRITVELRPRGDSHIVAGAVCRTAQFSSFAFGTTAGIVAGNAHFAVSPSELNDITKLFEVAGQVLFTLDQNHPPTEGPKP